MSLAIWLTHFGTRHLRGTDHRRVCDACVTDTGKTVARTNAMFGLQQGFRGRSQPYSRRMFRPTTAYLDMLFADHGIFRLIHLNRHRLSPTACAPRSLRHIISACWPSLAFELS